MADKNLHDIKIDDIESSKKTPLKNILTLLALLFIILVISVVITKLILNTDEGQEIDGNTTTTEASVQTEEATANGQGNALAATGAAIAGATGAVIAGTQNAATNTKDAVANTASDAKDTVTNTAKDAASTSKDTLKDAASTVTLKERNISGSKTKVTLRDHQPAKAVKESSAPKNTSTTSTPKKDTPVKKAPTKSYTESKSSTSSDKVVAKRVTPSKTSAAKSIVGYKLSTGYYIKVGTFKDTSTAERKIKKTGLNYKLIKTKNDKTMTRVLIGTFSTKAGAERYLKSVKANIASGAYITRIK